MATNTAKARGNRNRSIRKSTPGPSRLARRIARTNGTITNWVKCSATAMANEASTTNEKVVRRDCSKVRGDMRR